ncbi:MAG: hypothetical protein AAF598_14950, partial [Bacteroidota bacterium]
LLTVRGASKRSTENGTETLKTFKIGAINFKNTFATNGDLVGLKEQIDNFGGVLGRPIINRVNWLIDNPNKTVQISNQDLSGNGFSDIPLIPSSKGAPYTMIELGGDEYKVIIDLGSIAQLNVPKDHELADLLLDNYAFEDESRDRYTVGGLQTIIQQVATIPSIKIGDVIFENVHVAINESSQLRIGMNLFKNRVLYIDNVNKRYQVK